MKHVLVVLAALVLGGLVYDAKSGEEITRSVLTQIIFEEEAKGQNLLPINFLRQLIGFYGDSMEAFVPSYLEFSLESLTREQERFRKQLTDIGGEPFKAMEDHAKRNMAMFQQAMQMFNPFAAASEPSPAPKAESAEKPDDDDTGSELQALREQMNALQRELQSIAKAKK